MAERTPNADTIEPARTARWRHRLAFAAGAALLLLLVLRAYITPNAVQPTTEAVAAVKPLDLNRAPRGELQQVPGIGRDLANAIVERREKLGRFESLDDLRGVHGIGPKTLEKLRPWLTIGEDATPSETEDAVRLERKVSVAPQPSGGSGKMRAGEQPLDPNTASEADLQRLPGVGPTLASRIVAARSAVRFATVDDLRKVKGIGVKTLESLRPFVAINP